MCGGVFASPSEEAVLEAIKRVTGEMGCLIVVMNYAGDVLNFGNAVRRARNEEINCEMVVVSDDVSLPNIEDRRGICGTILALKMAGALASEGKTLNEVRSHLEGLLPSIATMGIGLTPCSLPGQLVSSRLASDECEIGMGIHNEPGREKVKMRTCDELVDTVVDTIIYELRQDGDGNDQCALLVNSLGGTSLMELSIIARRCMMRMKYHNLHPVRINIGQFMTSLDMGGASVTIQLTPKRSLRLLDAPSSAPAWKPFNLLSRSSEFRPSLSPSAFHMDDPREEKKEGLEGYSKILEGICNGITQAEDELNRLDEFCGDGDTGITFSRGARSLMRIIPSLNQASTSRFLHRAGQKLREDMGGTSGGLISGCLVEMGNQAEEWEREGGLDPSRDEWVGWFSCGLEKLKELGGGTEVGDRTMVDALSPALEALQEGLSWDEVVGRAQEGAESTSLMKIAKKGRAKNVPQETMEGKIDPGAQAIAIIFRAINL